MSGTSEGNKQAAKTTKERHGEDFFARIGGKSWQNPNRSRLTGFALQSAEYRAANGRKGGKLNKGKKKNVKKKNSPETEDTITSQKFTKEQLLRAGRQTGKTKATFKVFTGIDLDDIAEAQETTTGTGE